MAEHDDQRDAPTDGTTEGAEIDAAYVDFIWVMKQNDNTVMRILEDDD